MRHVFAQLDQFAMRDVRNQTVGERQDAMIHPLQHQAVQIDEIARDLQGRDLPSAILHDDLATCDARKEMAAFLWFGVGNDDRFAFGEQFFPEWEGVDSQTLGLGQDVPPRQHPHEQLDRRHSSAPS